MCGLVGIAGNVGINLEKAFKRLLELDTGRGPHSTGVFAVKSGGDTVLAKSLGTPWDLAETKGFNACFTGVIKVLLGHNRWATKGKINKQNAHPFEFNTLAGAHNGTLRSVDTLDDYKQFDVDSENLYHHMARNGVDETIPKLNGAFALTWYDKIDGTVNLIRNDERSLFFTYTEDMKTVLWASEDWMLLVAAAQSEVKILKPQMLPVGVLHSFDLPKTYQDKIGVRVRRIDLYKGRTVTQTFPKDDKRVVELRPKQEVTQAGVTHSQLLSYVDTEVEFFVASKDVNAYGQAFIQCYLEEDEKVPVRVYAPEDGELWKQLMGGVYTFKAFVKTWGMDNSTKFLVMDLRTIIEIVPSTLLDDTPPLTFIGYQGEELTSAVFSKRTLKGCAWCATPVEEKDAEDLVWFAKSDFICGDCAVQEEVQKYLAK